MAVNPYVYKLDLSRLMRIHPVFYVSLLSPISNDPVPGQQQLTPPPVEIESQEECEVETVLDSRKRCNRFEYPVRYTGYDEPLWQPLEELEYLPNLVKEFYERCPNKSKPIMS
ncbi:uncharacterized protein H6S33_007908 [Morchella sextelata]|uniref:uncharacterized protein n=1 Tax=Morchella sextelata TaxID=1174677 RepID=UPI001D059F1D|nr:uncharacterized protein H6S33_007908 [Morchella sextelata]KAH0603586.1 hypothetical protein H6S33_007908 [Morchella sextelata]